MNEHKYTYTGTTLQLYLEDRKKNLTKTIQKNMSIQSFMGDGDISCLTGAENISKWVDMLVRLETIERIVFKKIVINPIPEHNQIDFDIHFEGDENILVCPVEGASYKHQLNFRGLIVDYKILRLSYPLNKNVIIPDISLPIRSLKYLVNYAHRFVDDYNSHLKEDVLTTIREMAAAHEKRQKEISRVKAELGAILEIDNSVEG